MPRITRDSVRDAIAGSAVHVETNVVTLSDGTEVPFSVIPWVHHKAMEDMAIRSQVAASMNRTAPEINPSTLGVTGVVFRSVLDHDGSRIFGSEDEVDAWLASLPTADLELVEQAAQHVREATSLSGPLADGVTLADVGKASSRPTPH